jgi:uncharacterized protein (TIGR02246 family)
MGMRIPGTTWALIAALVMAAAPGRVVGQQAGRAADSLAVLAASRAFSDAYVAGDMETLGSVYTEDAVLYPPGSVIRGRAAIRRYFAPGPNRTNLAHAMTSERLTFDGDVAVDVGVWSNTLRRGSDAPQSAEGRYLVVWRREPDGRWRIEHDMWHRPAPTPTGGLDPEFPGSPARR